MKTIIRDTAIGLTVVTAISSCTPISPWERGILAKSQMTANPNPLLNSSRGHIYGSREAGASSLNSGGGGCGCY
ncbi:MAG: hypothetical protein Kow0065_20490 [Methylomicrobium sp.]